MTLSVRHLVVGSQLELFKGLLERSWLGVGGRGGRGRAGPHDKSILCFEQKTAVGDRALNSTGKRGSSMIDSRSVWEI